MSVEIVKMLDLSMHHITPETAEWIRTNNVSSYESEYGFVIPSSLYVTGDIEMPKDLKLLLAYAEEVGCDYILLDRDGQLVGSKLPTYDWGELL